MCTSERVISNHSTAIQGIRLPLALNFHYRLCIRPSAASRDKRLSTKRDSFCPRITLLTYFSVDFASQKCRRACRQTEVIIVNEDKNKLLSLSRNLLFNPITSPQLQLPPASFILFVSTPVMNSATGLWCRMKDLPINVQPLRFDEQMRPPLIKPCCLPFASRGRRGRFLVSSQVVDVPASAAGCETRVDSSLPASDLKKSECFTFTSR